MDISSITSLTELYTLVDQYRQSLLTNSSFNFIVTLGANISGINKNLDTNITLFKIGAEHILANPCTNFQIYYTIFPWDRYYKLTQHKYIVNYSTLFALYKKLTSRGYQIDKKRFYNFQKNKTQNYYRRHNSINYKKIPNIDKKLLLHLQILDRNKPRKSTKKSPHNSDNIVQPVGSDDEQ